MRQMAWRRPLGFAGTITLAALAVSAAAQPRAMTAVELLDLPTLESPQLSPDGKLAVYVEQRSDWQANERVSDLWTVRPGSAPVALTRDAYEEYHPRFIPNHPAISFLSKRKGDSYRQLYMLPVGGGEPQRLSRHRATIRDYRWAPDGKSVYFLADAATPAELRARRRAKDDMLPFGEDPVLRHVWRLTVDTGAIDRVTPGDVRVGAFDLSRDGKLLAFHVRESSAIDDLVDGEIWAMKAAGGSPWRVTTNSHGESGIEISPDNKAILFKADVNGAGEPYYDSNLFVVPSAGGQARLLQGDASFEVEAAHWGRDAGEIFVRANMGVRSELVRVDVARDRADQWTDDVHSMTDWSYSPEADSHATIFRSVRTPGDLYLLPRGARQLQAVTNVGAASVANFRLPRQQLLRFAAADGQVIEALLNYPIDYQPGQRYPLVVYSHGGPRSSDQYGLWTWRNYQPVLAARGWAFLTVNYRGGRGYGDAFMRDMVGRYFNNAHTDVLAGVDHVIAMGVADPDRLAVSGWSAGGHMTNKLITITDRFKAASSGAGAVEWVSMTGESDVSNARSQLFGGRPWLEGGPVDIYRADSPIYDMWRVRTPTLIFVGEKDVRVPPSQSKMLFRALQDNGVETRLYIAPREPHGFTELRHRLFKINAELDWFERHVTQRPYTFEPAPNTPPPPTNESEEEKGGMQ